MAMKRTIGLVWMGCLALVLGLESGRDTALAAEKDKKGTQVTIDGLTSTAPADWKEEEPSEIAKKFRFKQFRLPKVEGDKGDAEVVIFFFGPGGGGSIQENIKRWQGMFIPPKGKKIKDITKIAKMKVGSVPVTLVDLQGIYKFKKAPFVPDSKAELRPHHHLIGVVFESKDGPYWFRLVGPAKTVAHHKKGFDQFLKSFK
jgi:hypothetical protein